MIRSLRPSLLSCQGESKPPNGRELPESARTRLELPHHGNRADGLRLARIRLPFVPCGAWRAVLQRTNHRAPGELSTWKPRPDGEKLETTEVDPFVRITKYWSVIVRPEFVGAAMAV